MGIRIFLPFCVFALFWGCTKNDPKIDVASYLEISDYKVVTDSVLQGTNVHSFVNVLVFSKTKNYGYFPLPGKIPLPLSGETFVNIRPAIKVNGIQFLRIDYPLMAGYDTVLQLEKGKTIKLSPVFNYYTNATFPVIEDFEKSTGFTVKNTNAADTFTTVIDTANAIYGNKCLKIRLNSSNTICQVQSSSGFSLPTNGSPVYVEFNFKSNFKVDIGLIGSNSPGVLGTDQRFVGGANPSDTWKKMYIDLTPAAATPPKYNYYFLYFYTMTAYDLDVPNPEIYIDNIKVVHL